MKDGVLNIYKQQHMTSFDVVAKLRSLLKIRKIGHTGTLDPDATGVLPVCLGKATKLVSLLEHTDKTYRAEMRFGLKTDTQDISGTVLQSMSGTDMRETLGLSGFSLPDAHKLLLSRMLEISGAFTGEIMQVPPMYSALKVGGVKLVDAARKGKIIERKPRPVTVYEIRDIKLSEDLLTASFEVQCGKGTYIRTLCEDLGAALGVPSCLSALERTEASGLRAEDALTLEQVKQLLEEDRLDDVILPPDQFLSRYGKLTVNEIGKKKLLAGNFLYGDDLEEGGFAPASYRIYGADGTFYALYRFDEEKGCLRPEKMFL